jgi:RNA polymerase sigma factor (sigma-70 family)
MASTTARFLLQHVRRLADDEAAPDADLVRSFMARRDEAAFTTLVRRHGPMVLSVCHSVLRRLADAEDAFQATFLLLARKVGSIRNPAAVSSWLHGVAHRLALNARAAAARRLLHEMAVDPPQPSAQDDLGRDELRKTLHDELARLPERFRAPLWLCYLEGLSRDEAAGRLGWSATTVKGRVQRGLEMLRRRLGRRGFAPVALATVLSGGVAESAPLAASLVEATVAAVRGDVPARVAALTAAAAGWGLAAKLMMIFGLVLTVAALVVGAVAQRSPAPPPSDAAAERAAQPAPADGKPAQRPPEATPAKVDGDPLPEGALGRLGSLRLRHTGLVGTVGFSPDSRLLLSAGGDGVVRLWDAVTGKQRREIDKHYHVAAFSPDGEWVAVVQRDGTIMLHEVFIGKNTRRIGTHAGTVLALAFTADGKSLASANQDGSVAVWDVAGARRKRLFHRRPTPSCTSVAFSPDGKLLASGGVGGNGSVWDAATGEERYGLIAAAVAFAPDGKLLAAADLAGVVRLLEPASGEEVGKLAVGRSHWRPSVAFSADSKLLAAGSDDTLRLFDVAARRELHRVTAAPGGVQHVAFSGDGKALAWTAGYAVHMHEVPAWKERLASDGHVTEIDALAYSPDGTTIASGGTHDDRILLWDTATGKQHRAIDCEGQGAHCLAFAPDGRSLAAGLTRYQARERTAIAIWDVASGKRLHELGHYLGANTIAYSADGKWLAANDIGITVWDTKTGKQHSTIQPAGQMVHSLAFTPRGRSLLCTTYGLPLSEWDIATGTELRRFDGGPLAHLRMAVFPGGRYLAVGWRTSADTPKKNSIRIWEVASGKEVAALCPDDSMADAVAISGDGRLIACLRHDATIRVYDVLTGDELRRFHDRALPMVVAFSPDGKTLASAGWDTTVTLWDVKDLTRKVSRPEPLSRAQATALCTDLEGGDAVKAYAAVRALARVPGQAVPLLRERLTRPAPIAERVAKLIAELDDDDFKMRERASAELKKIGTAAEAALRRALEGNPSPEAKRRIEVLLEHPSMTGVAPEFLAALRALEVLQLIGTPESHAVVKAAAKGVPGTPATEAAREALGRFEK